MQIITTEQFHLHRKSLIQKIKEGSIFIYPTDTIYGIGCNALDKEAVAKIRMIKNRPEQPFSIIIPGLEWVEENCIITSKSKKWLAKLPGPYTLILQLRNKNCLAKNVIPKIDSIGIRYPDHWISKLAVEIGVPIVTTSVNKSGEEFMLSPEYLNQEIEKEVDFLIDEGEKKGRPSKVVDVEKEEIWER
ncbi:MAG TPA: L-threonylcarbamoyladenylate synthase [Candidatus Nanoarchaeia archaeon]|nr:L-threonylcarbamoyladenylate synthase [Candidatus Nanoarchaeia archaeon]